MVNNSSKCHRKAMWKLTSKKVRLVGGRDKPLHADKGEYKPPSWGSEVWKSSKAWKLSKSEERRNGGMIHTLDQRLGGLERTTKDGTKDGTDGQRRRRRTTTTGHDGTRRDGRKRNTHLYMIIKFQIEHWDHVSNVSINRSSTLRFRHPQSNPAG